MLSYASSIPPYPFSIPTTTPPLAESIVLKVGSWISRVVTACPRIGLTIAVLSDCF